MTRLTYLVVCLMLAVSGCAKTEPPPTTVVVHTEPVYPPTPAACRVVNYESFKLIPKEQGKPDVDASKVVNNTQKFVVVRNLERTTACNCAIATLLHDSAELESLGDRCKIKTVKNTKR